MYKSVYLSIIVLLVVSTIPIAGMGETIENETLGRASSGTKTLNAGYYWWFTFNDVGPGDHFIYSLEVTSGGTIDVFFLNEDDFQYYQTYGSLYNEIEIGSGENEVSQEWNWHYTVKTPQFTFPAETHDLTPTLTWEGDPDYGTKYLVFRNDNLMFSETFDYSVSRTTDTPTYYYQLYKGSSASGEKLADKSTTIDSFTTSTLAYGNTYYLDIWTENNGYMSVTNFTTFKVVNHAPDGIIEFLGIDTADVYVGALLTISGLTCYDQDDDAFTYKWTLSDGIESHEKTTSIFNWRFWEPGSYTVKLAMQDSIGAINNIEKTIKVVAIPYDTFTISTLEDTDNEWSFDYDYIGYMELTWPSTPSWHEIDIPWPFYDLWFRLYIEFDIMTEVDNEYTLQIEITGLEDYRTMAMELLESIEKYTVKVQVSIVLDYISESDWEYQKFSFPFPTTEKVCNDMTNTGIEINGYPIYLWDCFCQIGDTSTFNNDAGEIKTFVKDATLFKIDLWELLEEILTNYGGTIGISIVAAEDFLSMIGAAEVHIYLNANIRIESILTDIPGFYIETDGVIKAINGKGTAEIDSADGDSVLITGIDGLLVAKAYNYIHSDLQQKLSGVLTLEFGCDGWLCGDYTTVDLLKVPLSSDEISGTLYMDDGFEYYAPDLDDDGIMDTVDDDDDGDTYLDEDDVFPMDPTEWEDTDDDGIGNNADIDDDDDGYIDTNDDFPLDPDEWNDVDGDGLGDNSDPDIDNDGYENDNDEFPLDKDEWSDLDGDGTGDNSDDDIDGDGVVNSNDAFSLDPFEWSDNDKDGIGDNEDFDDDNDGISDFAEIDMGTDPLDPSSVPSEDDIDEYKPEPDANTSNDNIAPFKVIIKEPINKQVLEKNEVKVVWELDLQAVNVSYYIRIDEGGWKKVISSEYMYEDLDDGIHMIQVKAAKDGLSHIAEVTISINEEFKDNQVPLVTISSPVNAKKYSSTSVWVRWVTSDEGSINYQFVKLDNDEPVSIGKKSTKYLLTNLEPGRHTLSVITVDDSGNTGHTELYFIIEEEKEVNTGQGMVYGLYYTAAGLIVVIFVIVLIAGVLIARSTRKKMKPSMKNDNKPIGQPDNAILGKPTRPKPTPIPPMAMSQRTVVLPDTCKPETKVKSFKCPNCRRKIKPHWKSCPDCGEDFEVQMDE